MAVMEAVWPITALYTGPLGLWAYWRWGRPKSAATRREHGEPAPRRFGVRVAVGASHCGAGCTLGDIIATWIVFATRPHDRRASRSPTSTSSTTPSPSRSGSPSSSGRSARCARTSPAAQVLGRAFKADALSLTAFEVGLFGWMAIMQLVLFTNPHLPPTTASYWFLMQVGMALGFLDDLPGQHLADPARHQGGDVLARAPAGR